MSEQQVSEIAEVSGEAEISTEQVEDQGGEELSQDELQLLEGEESSEGNEPSAETASQEQKDVQNEVNKEIQKWVLKGVKGEDIEVSDINDLVKRAQKGVGAELKFQEAAEIKKEAAQLIKMLSEDPLGLLEELGLDTVELSKKKLKQQLEEEAKSPEQKQREQELKELEEARHKLKQMEEEKKNSEYQKLVAEEERKLEEGMVGALQEQGLPVKPAYIKRMSEIMEAGLTHGVELTPKEALNFARKEVVKDLRELLDVAPDDMLEDLIGSNNAKRMRKRYLTKAREKSIVTPAQIKPSDANSEPRERKPKGTVRDWMRGKVTLD
jgi:hypothetical protein